MLEDLEHTPEFHHELCWACGYALNGLPENGVCPECGETYDVHSLRLAGIGRGAQAGETTARWSTVLMLCAVNAINIWFALPLGEHAATSLWTIGFWTMTIGGLLWQRLAGGSDPIVVIIGPDGYCQKERVDLIAGINSARQRLLTRTLTFGLVWAVLLTVFFRDWPLYVVIAALLVTVGIGSILRRRHTRGDPTSSRPKLKAWSRGYRPKARKLSAERYRLSLEPIDELAFVTPVDAEVKCSQELANAFLQGCRFWIAKPPQNAH